MGVTTSSHKYFSPNEHWVGKVAHSLRAFTVEDQKFGVSRVKYTNLVPPYYPPNTLIRIVSMNNDGSLLAKMADKVIRLDTLDDWELRA